MCVFVCVCLCVGGSRFSPDMTHSMRLVFFFFKNVFFSARTQALKASSFFGFSSGYDWLWLKTCRSSSPHAAQKRGEISVGGRGGGILVMLLKAL